MPSEHFRIQPSAKPAKVDMRKPAARTTALEHVVTKGARADVGYDIDPYIKVLGARHPHRKPSGHLWVKSSEASTHGFGQVDDATAQHRLDKLTVGALRRLGFKNARLDT